MKLATIGTSWITEMFIEAAKDTGRFEIHAIYSRNIERARELAGKHGAEFACDSFEALVKSGADTVYIASPNKLHFEQAMFFLERGRHVICEKPMVTREGQLRAMFEAASRNGVFVIEAFRHIQTPEFQIIKSRIEEIRPIRSVLLSFNQYSPRYDLFLEGKTENVFSPEFDGGAKFDLGSYPVSLSVALFGEPLNVRYVPVNLQNGVCGAGSYIFQYDGFICCIMFSKISQDIIGSQIVGEKGGISFGTAANLENVSLCLRGGQVERLSSSGRENPLRWEAEAFARIIEREDKDMYGRLSEISEITNKILISY